jgi:ribonuclease P protein component
LESIKKRSDFLAAAKTEIRWVSPAFILQLRKRDQADPLRFGITASRKVGGAVVRNRAKRRLRALLKQTLPHHGLVGADYILIARKESLTRNFSLMTQELEQAVKRLSGKR